MGRKNTNEAVLTFKDFDDIFSGFKTERERIKYMSRTYGKMNLADAFSKFYDTEITVNTKDVNKVTTIELGRCYWGTVESITKQGVEFSMPGIKEQIVSKENFSDCMENVQNWLLNHDNMLRFEVREKRHGVYYVSILNGFYKLWTEAVERATKRFETIDVHIDSLTKGGYLCHTNISPLVDLTGKNYTSSVFIPGSNIVLNIERDFDRWIGQDVQIIPQKFAKFSQYGMPVENSIIGSRKLVLQMTGNANLYEIYNRNKLVESMGGKKEVFDGTVTGIINSATKTGIFVELNDKYITGLMPIDAMDLLDYKPGDQIKVSVKEFEIQEGKEPFVLNKRGQVINCNTRCVFEIA